MWFHVRVHAVEPRRTTMIVATAATPARLSMDELEWLDEDAGHKESAVDDGQRLQQPVGRALLVAAAVSSQDRHRQSVTDPAGHTQRSDQVDLDDESVCRRRRIGRPAVSRLVSLILARWRVGYVGRRHRVTGLLRCRAER